MLCIRKLILKWKWRSTR